MGQKSEHNEPTTSSADAIQNLPQPVVSVWRTYQDGYVSNRFSQPRHQLLYSVSGLMMAETKNKTWAVPSGYGLIVPAGVRRQNRMIGKVELQSLFIDPDADKNGSLDLQRIVAISPLLASLIAEFCKLENCWEESGKAPHLGELILFELAEVPTSPLALSYPEDRNLRLVCDALVAEPSSGKSIDHWAYYAGMSRRSFTRKFQTQTGLSFGKWRQRLRHQVALKELARGKSLHAIAAELGYASGYSLDAMMGRLK